jgi:ADP-heptose:LPS heptosyltransferase
VRKLKVVNDAKGLDYFIPSADEMKIGQLFPAAGETDFIAFVIGAKHVTKSLPEHKIIFICNKIVSPVILLGGLEDREKGERIASEAGGHVFNACGKLNINQSASVIKQASMVITHDTGLMHIAAAFKKEIISIWGNTIPEFGMYPYLPENPSKSHILEVKGLSCRPCSKLGYDICPEKHFKCMEEIPEIEILKIVSSKQ